MTQREYSFRGEISQEMKTVAENEGVKENEILNNIKEGTVVILKNKVHNIKPIGIGKNLSIKINANIGTSPYDFNLAKEIEKLKIAEKYGSDTVMDLSVGGDIDKTRKILIKEAKIPFGTVPIYQAFADILKAGKNIEDLKITDFLKVLQKHAEDGVDFVTIHAGLTRKALEASKKRKMPIVSRGGALLGEWMSKNNCENFLYEYYDDILDILKEYDIVISLGDGLRPGCIDDATDEAQLMELFVLGELTERAWDKGVQVMVEGPGHVPYNQIESNIILQKRICKGAPFYILGPLVTDIAAGYDHIAGAIGAALAARAGADFLCYLTPAEHLSLPSVEDVREGVIASKIVSHAIDLIRGNFKAIERNKKMSEARRNLDWDAMFKHVLDPEKAREYREKSKIGEHIECTMCGDFCSVKRKF
ncbi:MAG TPA: phosphomethylpyrimidine synthase ThiC [Spirochaetota bacterium]|nr:phosphomethylpyrimidine synthase ThiC [Spirochaetota bacterium]HOM39247.1 phosphomethylpyrimidine synthase ThiC [Spirochaetota bacterium]HPQ48654.1 phosphomethylpyrimidine synthase ThiC [Spirochaetota bacterium]